MAGVVQPVADTKSYTQTEITCIKSPIMHASLSKRWAGIDFKVWLSLLTLVVLSAGLFAYKVAVYVPCPDLSTPIKGKLSQAETGGTPTFYVNEQISFSVSGAGKESSIVWNFDDNSEKKAGIAVAHVYAKEGYYLVKAML